MDTPNPTAASPRRPRGRPRGSGGVQRLPGADLVVGRLQGMRDQQVAQLVGKQVADLTPEDVVQAHFLSSLGFLHAVSTSKRVPLGLRVEAAMKVSDAALIFARPPGRPGRLRGIGPESSRSERGDSRDGPPDELSPEAWDDLLGGEVPPAAAVGIDEEIPPGWGEEPPAEQAGTSGDAPNPEAVPTEPAAAPGPRKLGRPKGSIQFTTAERIMRVVAERGPMHRSSIQNLVRTNGFRLPEDFKSSLDFLCERGRVERVHRGPRNTVFYGTPEQVAREKERNREPG